MGEVMPTTPLRQPLAKPTLEGLSPYQKAAVAGLVFVVIAGGTFLVLGPAEALIVVIVLLFVGLIGAFVASDISSAKAKKRRLAEAQLGYHVRMDQQDASELLAHRLASSGASISTHSPSLINGTVNVKGSANLLIALLLWFICIVPMIIYVVSASKDSAEPFSVRIQQEGDGVRVYPTGQGAALERVVDAVESLVPQGRLV